MPEPVLPLLAILLGFAGLIWSADRFVAGSAAIARNMGVSPLIIGLTIVSLGTSAPEILVSIDAALSDAGELAIGNALGSNIANIGLVLGVTALARHLTVQRHIISQEIPLLLGVTAFAGYTLWDAYLSRWEGLTLLALLVPAMAYLVIIKIRGGAGKNPELRENLPQMRSRLAVTWFALGLGLLIISARILVWGATSVAEYMGVSPLVIGLTVIALGTSLPELAASVISAVRGHHDIAVGNILGSNLFNLLAVMSLPGLIQPLAMSAEVFARDYAAMAGMTLLLAAALAINMYRDRGHHVSQLRRWQGGLFLLCYTFYYYNLFLAHK